MKKALKKLLPIMFSLIFIFNISSIDTYGNAGKPSWYSEALQFFQTTGTIPANYDYDGYITRGEVSYFLYSLKNNTAEVDFKNTSYDNPFADISEKDSVYYKYIINLYYMNIYNGVQNENGMVYALPNLCISREDAITMIVRTFSLKGINLSSYKDFSDCKNINDYAKASISICKDLGIVQGYSDKSLKPKSQITKLEFLNMVYKSQISPLNTNESLSNGEYRLSSFKDSLFTNDLEMNVSFDSDNNSLTRRVISNSNKIYEVDEFKFQLEVNINNQWFIIPRKSFGSSQVLTLINPNNKNSMLKFITYLKDYNFEFIKGNYRLIQVINNFEEINTEPEYIVSYFKI